MRVVGAFMAFNVGFYDVE